MRDTTPTTCTVAGCPQPLRVKARALCLRHANQYYYGLDPHGADGARMDNPCTVCGDAIPVSLKRGPAPEVCSPACSRERARRRTLPGGVEYERKRALLVAREYYCVDCSVFLKHGGEAGPTKRCAACARELRRVAIRHSLTRSCDRPDCDRPMQARGRCSAHYKVWLREQGRMGQSGWGPRRKANRAVRDQHLATRRTGINPTVARLLARDGTDCGWCSQPLDMTLTYPHRMYRTIDHVVPLSKGGDHSMDNTRLLHWTCNSARNNSDALTKSDAKSASQAA